MNVKESKLTQLNLNANDVMTNDKCAAIKGGGQYYCCARNKWITY